ncbi:hypothetical protein EOPP23_09655 [Endozoicomonas sp. OPT23]|uniref:hypothetical protein n=1 Tax=Endozoicomonas sp. OPT23 TaxID=2072845 RepID=UPI00129AA3C8|nr:hypothetical protein [Endozoicomonas sp. OPT23]MRI33246.1 hypothetical protein [Endozoicomonas sp. OPT23]
MKRLIPLLLLSYIFSISAFANQLGIDSIFNHVSCDDITFSKGEEIESDALCDDDRASIIRQGECDLFHKAYWDVERACADLQSGLLLRVVENILPDLSRYMPVLMNEVGALSNHYYTLKHTWQDRRVTVNTADFFKAVRVDDNEVVQLAKKLVEALELYSAVESVGSLRFQDLLKLFHGRVTRERNSEKSCSEYSDRESKDRCDAYLASVDRLVLEVELRKDFKDALDHLISFLKEQSVEKPIPYPKGAAL